jgi:gliding motility-associated-like protein
LAKLRFIFLVFIVSYPTFAQRIYGGLMDRRVLSSTLYSYGFGCTYFTDQAGVSMMPAQIKLTIYRKSDDKVMRTVSAQKQPTTPSYTASNCNKELKTQYVSVDYVKEEILKPDEFKDIEGYYVVSESVGVRSVSDNTTSKGVVLYHWFSPSYLFDLLEKEKGKVTVQWKPDAYNYFCNKLSNTISIIVKFTPPTSVVGSTIDFPLLGSTCRQAAPFTDNNGVLPFKEIDWNTGFSTASQLPGGGPGVPLNPPVILDYAQELQIIISATPTQTGIYTTGYVFAFFRDKVKLCEMYREYQLQIVDCPTSPKAVIRLSEVAKPSIVADTKLCEGETVQLNAGVGQSEVSYEWAKDGVKIMAATDSILVVKEAGNYTVTVNKKGSCDPALSDNQTIVVLSKPNATIASSVANGVLCVNGSIKLTASPNTADWTYQWLRNDIVIGTGTNSVYDAIQAGKYSVKVSDSNKCTSTISSVFEIKAALPTVIQIDSIASLCVDSSRPYKLSASPKGGVFAGLGVKGDSLFPNILNIGRNEISYSINKMADCVVGTATKIFSATICVKANLHLPDAFSPNNDGINDTWVIRGLEEYPEAELTIFDRWGNAVFNQKGSNQKPFDGHNLPTGVYAYQILTKINGTIFRGSVTLLR